MLPAFFLFEIQAACASKELSPSEREQEERGGKLRERERKRERDREGGAEEKKRTCPKEREERRSERKEVCGSKKEKNKNKNLFTSSPPPLSPPQNETKTSFQSNFTGRVDTLSGGNAGCDKKN